jgi:hypothetical protein
VPFNAILLQERQLCIANSYLMRRRSLALYLPMPFNARISKTGGIANHATTITAKALLQRKAVTLLLITPLINLLH